jgi:DNA-binding transcriptional MocR family regulator
MRYTNKRIKIIAIDLPTYNVALQACRNTGYKCIPLNKTVDEDGTTWYRAVGIRLEDMRYKIFGV